MDWFNLLTQIFEVCIIPLLGILTTYIVKYIQVKSAMYLSAIALSVAACHSLLFALMY